MTRPKRVSKKDTTKARSAKLGSAAGTKKTGAVTETRPKPRPTYKGATAHQDADEKVASAALMMLGHDKTHPGEVVKNVGGLDHDDDDDNEVMDEDEEEGEIEEIDGDDGLMNEVESVENLNEVDGAGDDDDDSSRGTVHHISESLNTYSP